MRLLCPDEYRISLDNININNNDKYKVEIINTAEYLNTNFKEDQFVNIVESHESTQRKMNSIIKTAAKITEELIQPNE